MKISDNARLVLAKRYLLKDEQGEVAETPEDMFARVAHVVAQADRKYDPDADTAKTAEQFFQVMVDLDFLPNSPTLMNAGRRIGQLSACFVLPIDDSIDSIFETLKHTALIHKSGGGTGFSFSRLRPANDEVRTTRGVSSGPVSFIRIFDVATETIKQGGTRRGANMAVLRVDHPDIREFIAAKRTKGLLNNFNISVALTEEFMRRVEQGVDLPLINPRSGAVSAHIPARVLFDEIVAAAWEGGEPGILFLDRINADNTLPELPPIEATNPCGEQPLLPYESCNLGSINLSRFVTNGDIDWHRLAAVIETAIHFLDNVIDVNVYPLKQIEAMTLAHRKIGLGVMGFADLLIGLDVAYDNPQAVAIAEKVMAFINQEAKKASAELARKRGNFPRYPQSVYNRPQTPFMRNATHTTIAPTGTISIIASCSSGIEPLFALCYSRHVLETEKLIEINPLFLARVEGKDFFDEGIRRNIMARGMIRDMKEIPEAIRNVFVTAMEIAPEVHIRIQAAFQRHTDNAVSKTINFPPHATHEDIKNAYWLAFQEGVKGLTIYRYGSRQEQVLRVEEKSGETNGISPRPRPARTYGLTERVKTGCGNLYVTVNTDEKGTCEVFASMGKTGGCASSQIEALGRLVSLALRSGISLKAIEKQLFGIRCPSPIWQNGQMVLSCPDAVAKVLRNKDGGARNTELGLVMSACPDCGGALHHEEGCLHCRDCGFSKCE